MSASSVLVRSGGIDDYARARAVIAATFAFHQQAAPEIFRETDSPAPTQRAIEELL
jgi:hypothetical protein